jgi:hypothetical protein
MGYRTVFLLVFSLFVLLSSGCGYKGDLVVTDSQMTPREQSADIS